MANVSSSNGLEKYPKLRFKGFSEPWTQVLLSDIFKKSTKKNSDGSITNVICNSAKNGLIPQKEYFELQRTVFLTTWKYQIYAIFRFSNSIF